MKIKKGDQIKIISGNDKGKAGKVLVAIPDGSKIVVEGINIKKKHVRPRERGKKGELVRIPGAFPASRAMVICPQCGKPTRVGYKINGSGVKSRICRRCGGKI